MKLKMNNLIKIAHLLFYMALPAAESSEGAHVSIPPVLQHKQSLHVTVSTVLPTQGLI